MTNQRRHQVNILGKTVRTPTKSVSDTFKNKVGEIDTQKHGKPDFSHYQIEEFRNRLTSTKLTKLKDEEKKEQMVETLATNLRSTEAHRNQNIHIGYTATSKKTRENLEVADRIRLIKASMKADLDVYVTPQIEETVDLQYILDTIDKQIQYAQKLDHRLLVVPSISVSGLTSEYIKEIVDHIEDNYSREEVPIIATEKLYPLCNSNDFHELRKATERAIMVSSCRNKVHNSKYDYGRLSAEYISARMGADIILDYYHTGLFEDEEDEEEETSVTDLSLDMVENTMDYNQVSMENGHDFDCNCFIHRIHEPGEDIEHWGSQEQERVPEKLHNETLVSHKIRTLRQRIVNEEMDQEERETEAVTKAIKDYT